MSPSPNALQTSQDARQHRVADLVKPPLADATRRSQESATRGFVRWLQKDSSLFSEESLGNAGVAPENAEPIHVVRYLAELEARGLRASTIRKVSSGIGGYYRRHGLFDPTSSPLVAAAVENLARAHGSAPVNRRRPITVLELQQLSRHCPSNLTGQRDLTLLLTLFCSGLRRGELTALDVGDLEWVDGRGVILHLRRSKTDQRGEGQHVAVKLGGHLQTCPVRQLRAWIDAAGIQEGALFRAVSRSNRPLGRLGTSSVNWIIKQAFSRAQLPAERIGSHSFRRGVATALAESGARLEQVATHLRHASVDMSRQYIERAEIWDAVPLEKLGL